MWVEDTLKGEASNIEVELPVLGTRILPQHKDIENLSMELPRAADGLPRAADPRVITAYPSGLHASVPKVEGMTATLNAGKCVGYGCASMRAP